MEKQVSMKNEFVIYPLALRLKALDFKERVLTYFEDDKIKLHDHISGWDFNSSFLNCVSRPTYSQAFRWFREKYNLWSCIQKYPTSENPNRCYYELKGDKINTDKDESPNSYMSGWFNSYEEAELACLEKLIEIVEEKHGSI